MAFDTRALEAFIEQRAIDEWSRNKKPYSISFVAIDLAKEGFNYKDALGSTKLRQWVTSFEFSKLNVLIDPVHKAKVSFLPKDVSSDFLINREQIREPSQVSYIKSRSQFLSFLKSLNSLSKEEIDQIVIPTSIIVKLLVG